MTLFRFGPNKHAELQEMHDGSAGQEGNTSPSSADYAATPIAPSSQQRRAAVGTNVLPPLLIWSAHYAAVIIATCFKRPSSPLSHATIPLVSPASSMQPECKTCSGRVTRAPQLSSMAAPPQQRAAACGREQAPHRRVDEVAHAGHQHPRYERLGKQQEYAGVNGKILSNIANPVISERKKTIGIFAI